jgi:hypothetical protein
MKVLMLLISVFQIPHLFSRKNESLLSSSNVSDIDEKADMYFNSNCDVKTFSESFGSIVCKHKLSDDAVKDILKLIKSTLPQPNKCPTNIRKIHKLMVDDKVIKIFKTFYVCKNCKKESQESELCSSCDAKLVDYVTFDVGYEIESIINRNDNLKYLIQSNIKFIIKYLIHFFTLCLILINNFIKITSKTEDHYNVFSKVAEKENKNILSNALDGSIYQNYLNNTKNDATISLCINSDGAPLLTSKNCAMWPVISKIVELPDVIGERFENLIFIGLWINAEKPEYELFISKCVEAIFEAMNYLQMKKIGK